MTRHGPKERADGAARHHARAEGFDAAYERRAILLLSIGFGLVALDRALIGPMFPTIMRELDLSYSDLGYIAGALAFTWGGAALVFGRLADSLGRARVLCGAMIGFSFLVGFSGLAASAMALIVLRSGMGLAEGAYVPPSIAATMEAARPDRQGLALGLQQASAPLLALAVAPLFVTRLLDVIDWRWIFVLVAVPGVMVAILLARVIREPAAVAGEPVGYGEPERDAGAAPDSSPRNSRLAAGAMLCWLAAIVTLASFMPSYLVDHLEMSTARMGEVLAIAGVGATVGCIAVPALSDRIGRKPAALLSAVWSLAGLLALRNVGDGPGLVISTAVTFFFLYALIALTVGPLAVEGLAAERRATASGIVVAVGEIGGGGLGPVVAGHIVADHGIERIFDVALVAVIVGGLICIAMRETAPRALARMPAT